jgi:hypothetical protein
MNNSQIIIPNKERESGYQDGIAPYDKERYYDEVINFLEDYVEDDLLGRKEIFKVTTVWLAETLNRDKEVPLQAAYSKTNLERNEEKIDQAGKIIRLIANDSTWTKAIDYLSSVAINIDEDLKHEKPFIISRLYQKFFNREILNINDEVLDEYDMQEYFQQGVVDLNLPEDWNFDKNKPVDNPFYEENIEEKDNNHSPTLNPREQFILAETIMVRKLILVLLGKNTDTKKEEFQKMELDGIAFLPVPIIHQAKLVGISYLIYQKKNITLKIIKENGEEDPNTLKHPELYDNLIRNFAEFLERTTVNITMSNFFPKQRDTRSIFYGMIEKSLDHPFLKSVNFARHYRQMERYAERQGKFAERFRKMTVQNAVSSIITDSFAHNHGAHSLVELKWYFEGRARLMDVKIHLDDLNGPFPIHGLQPAEFSIDELERIAETDSFHADIKRTESSKSDDEFSMIDLIRKMSPRTERDFFQYQINYHPNAQKPQGIPAKFPVPIDFAIYPFLQSLRDKSAFWSGVNRDTPFSGLSISWFDLIGRGFLGNPLFLGSITNSEGVNRISVFIELREPADKNESAKPAIISGEFARINLEILRNEKVWSNDNVTSSKGEEHEYSSYAFLQQGRDYNEIKEKLEDSREFPEVFLPGGIIGQQAFYTIIENTLRNIKHYKSELENIRKSGIRLVISIQKAPFIKRDSFGHKDSFTEPKLYRVGIWLHHKQELQFEENPQSDSKRELHKVGDKWYRSVIPDQLLKLKKRIITKEGKPRLGGSYQDKTCASMLMNNTFTSVDEPDPSKAKRHYYPYIFPASEDYHEIEERFVSIDSAPEARYVPKDSFVDIIHNKNIRVSQKELRTQVDNIPHSKLESRELLADIRRKKFKDEIRTYIKKTENQRNKGIVKKYFHLWISEKCKIIEANKIFEKGKIVERDQHIFESNIHLEDNPSRFKILIIKGLDFKRSNEMVYNESLGKLERRRSDEEMSFDLIKKKLRQEGMVRIIRYDPYMDKLGNPEQLYQYAMKKWMASWLNPDEEELPLGFKFRKVKTKIGETTPWFGLAYQNPELPYDVHYLNQAQIDQLEKGEGFPSITKSDFEKVQELIFNHSTTETKEGSLSIRSHCDLMNTIFGGKYYFSSQRNLDNDKGEREINVAQFGDSADNPGIENLYKFLEIAKTKIVLIDNRLHNRMEQIHEHGINKEINCIENYLKIFSFTEEQVVNDFIVLNSLAENVSEDDIVQSKNRKISILKHTNFLVMHFSMIEARRNKEGKKYGEDTLLEFFEKEIMEFYEENIIKPFPENFIFIVTSGRGNDIWINKLKEISEENSQSWESQISFRPIEDLVNAIEEGITYKDDFQVKFNLCQVFYGS